MSKKESRLPPITPNRDADLPPEEQPLKPKEVRYARIARSSILFFFAVLIALGIAWRMLRVLEIVYVAALFAVVLMPVVQRIQQLRIKGWSPSRPVAIIGLLLTVMIALTTFLWLGLPPVIHDIRDFANDLPKHIPAVLAKIRRVPLADKIGVDSVAEKAQNALSSLASYLFASLPLWMARILDIITTFVLCIYFMLEGEFAYYYFLSFFPTPERARLARTLETAELRMSGWLLGQGSLMLILGITSTTVFGILHVRYFFLLGVLMGLFNIIPVAGGIVTIMLAASAAAVDSWSKMAGVLIFYAIYIQIESAYLTPRIMKTSVNLMGLSVLIALLAGSALAGIVGALVAVPTAALVAVFMSEYLVQVDADDLVKEAESKA
ncbi:MAG TPA: AI-2E family transporter [Acidobacteriaceae bacterium]